MVVLSISSLGVTTSHAEEKIHIEAAAALLFDADTGKILHEQNPDELLAIASMSKLIVVYAVLEEIKEGKITWDTKVNISDYAYEVSRNNEFFYSILTSFFERYIREFIITRDFISV
ncbi:serine hydrolase, partial [Bacillus sp. SS-TM]